MHFIAFCEQHTHLMAAIFSINGANNNPTTDTEIAVVRRKSSHNYFAVHVLNMNYQTQLVTND